MSAPAPPTEFSASKSNRGRSSGEKHVRIRVFRAGDLPAVQRIFVDGMLNGLTAPCTRAIASALSAPFTCSLYALCGLSTSRYGWRALLPLGVLLPFVAWRIRKGFEGYCAENVADDLTDVAGKFTVGVITPSSGAEKTEEAVAGENEGDGQESMLETASGFWVAEDGGTGALIGIVGLDASPASHTAEIRRMSVRPPYRGRGVATRLAETCLAHVRAFNASLESQSQSQSQSQSEPQRIDRVVLTTSTLQKEAVRIYERMGWRRTREVLRVDLLGGLIRLFQLNEYELLV